MVKICPVSFNRINENLSRLNASFTFIMSLFFIITQLPVFLLVLVVDFLLRNVMEGRFSPVSQFNRYLIQLIHLPSHMINAGPKIFAARVGLFLSILSFVFFLFGNSDISIVFVGILAFFSLLEAGFNFCVACKLYPFLLPLNKYFEKG
ncbi:MAG: DUF4395 domain-containing protein [Bacteroidales bacterium]|nr:DUF4395 domain-containing protein [Bacteroidales bacterium]